MNRPIVISKNDIDIGYEFLKDYSRYRHMRENYNIRKKIEQLYCENKTRTSDENWFIAEKEILNDKKVK